MILPQCLRSRLATALWSDSAVAREDSPAPWRPDGCHQQWWEMAVQIEISRVLSMCFVYMSSCHFYSVWRGPLSRWPSIEHSSTKMASFTLTCVLNIVSQYHSYTFHIKIPLQHVSVKRRRCHHAWRNYLQLGLYIGCLGKKTAHCVNLPFHSKATGKVLQLTELFSICESVLI